MVQLAFHTPLRPRPSRGLRLLIPLPAEASGLIVAIAVHRDREAFRLLFLYFAPRVKSYLIRLGTPAQLADELAQETLLTVWRKAVRFDPARAGASTWIFTIARNLRIDAMRHRRKLEIPDDYYPDVLAVATPADHCLSAERVRKVDDAMKALPADQSEIVRLSFFEEEPHAEIAARLRIPLGTVKSRIRLAMSRLRASLEDMQ